MATMDARQLRYFVTVARLGSFSEAARRLHVAQPALSRHVKALEEQLGVQLLTRASRGVRPTRSGEDLLAHAGHLLEQLDLLPQLVGSRSRRISGRVVIGLPTSASAVIAVPLLTAAIARLPQVRVHLIESLSGYLQEWIEAGRLDLAIVYDPHPNAAIRIDPILVEDLWLVGGPDSLPRDRQSLPFSDLPRYPLVLPGATHSHRRLVEGLAERTATRLNLLAEVDSLTVQKAMLATGNVYTILARGAIHAELGAGTLQALRIVDPVISRTVTLATARSRSESLACGALARLTLEIANELAAAGVWTGSPGGSTA